MMLPMLPQKKYREVVLQLLFSIDMGRGDDDDAISMISKELSLSKKTATQAFERAMTIWNGRERLEQKIGGISQDYDFSRIGRVEQNILRLGLFELEAGEVDSEVAISEAVRLSRKFASPEAASFVNAIMDHAALSV